MYRNKWSLTDSSLYELQDMMQTALEAQSLLQTNNGDLLDTVTDIQSTITTLQNDLNSTIGPNEDGMTLLAQLDQLKQNSQTVLGGISILGEQMMTKTQEVQALQVKNTQQDAAIDNAVMILEQQISQNADQSQAIWDISNQLGTFTTQINNANTNIATLFDTRSENNNRILSLEQTVLQLPIHEASIVSLQQQITTLTNTIQSLQSALTSTTNTAQSAITSAQNAYDHATTALTSASGAVTLAESAIAEDLKTRGAVNTVYSRLNTYITSSKQSYPITITVGDIPSTIDATDDYGQNVINNVTYTNLSGSTGYYRIFFTSSFQSKLNANYGVTITVRSGRAFGTYDTRDNDISVPTIFWKDATGFAIYAEESGTVSQNIIFDVLITRQDISFQNETLSY